MQNSSEQNPGGKILVVDDELSMREFLSIALTRAGHDVVTAESGEDGLDLLSDKDFDLVITDLRMGELSGIDVLQKVRSSSPDTEVIVITAFATPENALEAMKAGAYDYIRKPFKVEEILVVCRRALERHYLAKDNKALRRSLEDKYKLDDIIGKSPSIRNVFEIIRKVAPTRTNVLISGESGTGKELVARAIHFNSPRAKNPFHAINCGAIPPNLLESELFGHIKGSFTGAEKSRTGLFREADGGSILLDEISELDSMLQVKLLRVLQERKVKPVGADEEETVDVRVMAATNRNLAELVKQGGFREDLFYRLNVIEVKVPPLRQRREDIPLLVDHFLRRFAAQSAKNLQGITSDALRTLMNHPFPGNVRQLENMVERAVTLSCTSVLDSKDFCDPTISGIPDGPQLAALLKDNLSLDDALRSVEKNLIEQALAKAGGVRTEAAKLLGISFRSLRYRLEKIESESEE